MINNQEDGPVAQQDGSAVEADKPNANDAPTTKGEAQSKSDQRKPQEVLPTDRVVFQKQLSILRAFGVAGRDKRPVSGGEVATMAQVKPSTVSLVAAFLQAAGLVSRAEGGFLPSSEVIEFANAHEWNADTAGTKLAPRLLESWFAETILPKLRFRELTQEEVLALLADASSASRDYKSRLQVLLDYLEAAGIIVRDGLTVRACNRASVVSEASLPVTPSPQHSSVVAGVGSTKEVALKSGGRMSLMVEYDPFKLSEEDRRFVHELIDRVNSYLESEQ